MELTGASLLANLKRLPSQGLGAPIMLMMILAMMVIPLPTALLDVLFTFNIALSIVVMLAVIYVLRPLEFSAFPTVLLVATLLRLSLNVASTRVVLLNGHEGPDAAGKVIQAFGEFVVGGHYVVGFVVFIILTVINFVVVTKGAGRISEVSARFTLDAMPGKQMAIDADLNAGVLNREEAKAKREEIREEADFYGSMDGASKFVRGDAMAGILILLINIIGGLVIGTMEHDLSFGDALKVYTLLTIGDGLVAQIPGLLLSTAVAILVTRMSRSQDMGAQLVTQMFGQPKALALTAALLGIMGLIPGMPNMAFLMLAGVCAAGAWMMSQRRAAETAQALALTDENDGEEVVSNEPLELSWDDVEQVDPLGLEVGYRLIPLVDRNQGGELMPRIKGIRKKLTQELGFLIPAVHIRDNLELAPGAYRITVQGVPLASGEIYPDREMALNPGHVSSEIAGVKTRDPAFGLEAVWIEPSAKSHAQALGYTVVDAATVAATHLSHVIKEHAHELFGHEEAQHLLKALEKAAPKLVEDLTPKLMPMSVVVKVMQNLLLERVPLRNLRGIAEALTEHGARSQEPVALTAAVRSALGRMIVQEINGLDDELPVLTLDAELERMLQDSVGNGSAVLEPALAERLHTALNQRVQHQEASGEPAVLLVPGPVRAMFAKFTRHSIPGLHVLAYHEVPDSKRIRLVGTISG